MHANEYGRFAALALLAVFGLSLLSPHVASVIALPVVEFGNRLVSSLEIPQRRQLPAP